MRHTHTEVMQRVRGETWRRSDERAGKMKEKEMKEKKIHIRGERESEKEVCDGCLLILQAFI